MRSIQLSLTLVLSVLSASGGTISPYLIQPIHACSTCDSTGVFAINNSGEIGGVAYGPNGPQGFYGKPGGGYTLFSVPGAAYTEVNSIRSDGTLGGDYFGAGGLQIYQRAPDGSFQLPPLLPGAKAQNGGNLNNSGLLVGNIVDDPFNPTFVTGYVLQNLTLKETFNVPGGFTQAQAVNDAGVIVGYTFTSLSSVTTQSFIRQPNGTLSSFSVPGSTGSLLHGINNNGDLAGGYFDTNGIEHGFVSRGGVVTTIDFTGQNSLVFGINDAGQAVGASYPTGKFFTGPYDGFLATPTPEPATWGFVGTGLLVLLRLRSARRF